MLIQAGFSFATSSSLESLRNDYILVPFSEKVATAPGLIVGESKHEQVFTLLYKMLDANRCFLPVLHEESIG